ncbi:MAG TPA: PaaI family thioesterase [Candidatus Dormibacteraeota bacterium]|nr:PaaI family thioesterase [Candidatus Dormibacteraeota bacterium]
MTAAITRARAQEMLDELPLVKLLGFVLGELGDGRCTLTAPFHEITLRPGGLVGGPVYMTLADVAVWIALMTIVGPKAMAVTSELTTSFLRGAVREDVICEARIAGIAGGLAHAHAECRNAAGTLLTRHMATYVLPA